MSFLRILKIVCVVLTNINSKLSVSTNIRLHFFGKQADFGSTQPNEFEECNGVSASPLYTSYIKNFYHYLSVFYKLYIIIVILCPFANLSDLHFLLHYFSALFFLISKNSCSFQFTSISALSLQVVLHALNLYHWIPYPICFHVFSNSSRNFISDVHRLCSFTL